MLADFANLLGSGRARLVIDDESVTLSIPEGFMDASVNPPTLALPGDNGNFGGWLYSLGWNGGLQIGRDGIQLSLDISRAKVSAVADKILFAIGDEGWSQISETLTSTVTKVEVLTLSDALAGLGDGFGCLALLDGRILIPPCTSGNASIFNPTDNSIELVPGFPGGAQPFRGACLLENGTVFCFPANSESASIFNPTDNSIELVPGFPGGWEFDTGVRMLDGRVFAPPYNASGNAAIFNPADNSIELVPGFPGGRYIGAVILGDGRVFSCPATATEAAIFNPADNSIELVPGFPGGWEFEGGVLMGDGRVFLVPLLSESAAIFNPADNSIEMVPGFPARFSGGALLPDGRVFCCPRESLDAAIFNPADNSIEMVSGFPGGMNHSGASVMMDGRIFLGVRKGGDLTVLDLGYGAAPYALSPFVNHY